MSDAVRDESGDEAVGWRLENSYARLPEALFERVLPTRFPEPKTVVWNRALARSMGLSPERLTEGEAALLFAGQRLPAGADPIAQAYAGHQYGRFTMLGDGRAILLGEQRTPAGALVDVQFKGSGPTRFSRRGDGRAALGPMLREYVVSEAMSALGIPTTRSLAVATTGETVLRDDAKRGAVLVRVAASHLRVGTLQFASARRDDATLRTLADYAIARHDPELAGTPDRYLGFLRAVVGRQASLIARWQSVGFVHGVMNTDNTAVSGETIDYGPCAFMDAYDPDTVFSSIDAGGRYRYSQQPVIAEWNLARLAEALLPLIAAELNAAAEMATEAVHSFRPNFEGALRTAMLRKIGLGTEAVSASAASSSSESVDAAGDDLLLRELLAWMQETGSDFTNTFRRLPETPAPEKTGALDRQFAAWRTRWLSRVDRAPASGDRSSRETAFALMNAVNPAVIPRNHRVEAALVAAEQRDDLAPFHDLVRVLSTPFALAVADTHYADPPPPSACDYRTFCGT